MNSYVHTHALPDGALPERAPPVTGPIRGPDRSLGALLIGARKISLDDVGRVLEAQKRSGLRFGEQAVKLRFVTQEDVRRALARQFDFPYLVPGEADIDGEVVAALNPFGRQAESLRALRSELMLRWFGETPQQRALAILSPGRGDGRTRLAVNLAVVFAQLGERTLLIDADLRRPRVHNLLRLSNAQGLSTAIAERGDAAPSRVPGLLDLSVLTSGPTPPNPQELLARPVFARLLERMRAQFSVVILDTPPAEESADAIIVAARALGCMLIARPNRTRLGPLQALADRLGNARTTLLGAVYNDY